jgi:hypothetical protein
MWIAAEHSDEENLRWSYLRAIEWIGWPLFLSQPIVPVLLYFFDWPWILLSVFLVTLLWRVTVLQWFVSVRLAGITPLFVLLKFLTCPLMAFLIWQQGDYISAVLALLWPLVGDFLIMMLLMIIHVLLDPFVPRLSVERTMHVGPIQNRFLNALGYTTENPIREVRGELNGPISPNGWQYHGHTIFIQSHTRLEYAHPLVRELFAPWLAPDWDCFVDGKLIGLGFASPVYAKNNGTAFVLKQVTVQEGKPMKLPEEEQAIRPKLHSYKREGHNVEVFLNKKAHLFEPQGWTCLVDGQLVGFGFRSRLEAKGNALLYIQKESGAG